MGFVVDSVKSLVQMLLTLPAFTKTRGSKRRLNLTPKKPKLDDNGQLPKSGVASPPPVAVAVLVGALSFAAALLCRC